MRIVSLLPSTTEILFAIGAGDDVVGVTFECDYPAGARTRRIVSTTALPHGLTPAEIDTEVSARAAAGEDLYRLDEGALRDLDPDLVITQDLCAVCAVDLTTVDAAMAHLGCNGRVLTIDPSRLTDVLESITTIGTAVGRAPAAFGLVAQLGERLDKIAAAVAGKPQPRLAVLEWTDPPYSAGHWVPDMVAAAGGISVLGDSGGRSKRIEPDAVATAKPDIVVVSPCGFRLPEAVQLAETVRDSGWIPDGIPVWAVDADASFVRPGPRLVDGIEALAAICHPARVAPRSDVAAYVGAATQVGSSVM